MGSEPAQISGRAIGIVFSDGGVLSLSAARRRGASDHGEETIGVVLREPDGATIEFSEALLSTEYGEDGVQRRATLELWTDADGAHPLRGAGSVIGRARVDRGDDVAEVAFFRWSLEGREGLGHYEIVHGRG